MTKVIVDASFGAKVTGLTGAVEVCDESGRTIGYFQPVLSGGLSAKGVRSPISDEEIERRSQERSGRPLADILADLEKR
jgi:hypothetical protein